MKLGFYIKKMNVDASQSLFMNLKLIPLNKKC